ncbi:MAG TPA: FHA domain-containing protein [Thermoanaerobaculia bacterium]|nr:FHA domain-containing protein [Thermoanaerobaculia bacterium]
MRDTVADKRCENGHFIDEAWDICPYCPAEHPSDPDIPIVRPTRSVAPQVEAPRTATAVPPVVPRRETAAVQPPPMERTVAAQKIDVAPIAKRYVVGWLVGLSGPSRGESFPIRIGRNVLGRDRKSDIVVNDDQASSHHADLVFRPEERRFILMDHNSTNGTYVNEAEIEPRRDLAGKDVIRIGSHKFLFMPLCHDGFYWDDEGALR